MSEETERRVARNEALLREVNEGIERGRWPGDDNRSLKFRCECSNLDCVDTVPMTRGEYEQVRSSGRRFALRPGHELPEYEKIVETGDGYIVIEKQDDAGKIAEQLDPRG